MGVGRRKTQVGGRVTFEGKQVGRRRGGEFFFDRLIGRVGEQARTRLVGFGTKAGVLRGGWGSNRRDRTELT